MLQSMSDKNGPLRRIPKYYDGKQPTGRSLKELLPRVLRGISQVHAQRPDLIVAGWADIVGPKIAGMTTAVKFTGGTLLVKVQSSTLLNVLEQYEKVRLIGEVKRRFPKAGLKNIIFRIG